MGLRAGETGWAREIKRDEKFATIKRKAGLSG